MRTYLIAYVATAVVFFGLDFAWISLTVKSLYKAQLGSLMLDKPNMVVGGVFYLIYVVGVIVFAVLPAVSEGNWLRALWAGALLGVIAYGTFDLTNQAILAGWSSTVSMADMAWGTFATATAATAGYFITKALV